MSPNHLSSLTDAELASLHLAGNKLAFEHLVNRYARQLYGYTRRFTGNDRDAEDIAQETFVRLHEHLPKLDLEKPLKPWLFTVCTNLCRNLAKRKRAVPFSQLEPGGGDGNASAVDLLESGEPTPEQLHRLFDCREHVRSSIGGLPEKYRVVTTLYYWDRLSYEEIAGTLSIPVNTVRTRIRRAKELLLPSLKRLL